MANKVYAYEPPPTELNSKWQLWFYCPGCKNSHAFTIGVNWWQWNGSYDKPSFTPSLMCNRGLPSQCHSWVTDGRIKFFGDSNHELAGQTVDIPDWEELV